MANDSGQAYGLTALSPIKPGLDVEIKTILDKLANGQDSPFALFERTHTARWVVIDNVPSPCHEAGRSDEIYEADTLKSKYLLFDSNFDLDDRGLDGYLVDLAQFAGATIGQIYSRCVGFDPKSGFATYIKRCQVKTTVFFADYATTARGSVKNVRHAVAQQEAFVQLVAKCQGDQSGKARQSVESFLEEWVQ